MSNCKTGLTNISSVERDPVFLSQKAKPGGVATLDANGKIPLSQIDLKAVFTEHDPVYIADRGVPFGVPTLDGNALVIKSFLGTGSPSSSTFLRGDGIWAVPAGGGGGTGDIKSDGTVPFAANESMGGFKLTNVGTPTVGTDAANKAYVDAGDIPEGWKLTGTDVSLATSTSKVIVGGLPTIAKFGVRGDNAADITVLIRAAAAQTADVLDIQDSSGVVLMSVGVTAYFEMKDGSTAPVSLVGHGRQRYNNTVGNKGFDVSVDGGPYERVIADEREVERIAAMLDL